MSSPSEHAPPAPESDATASASPPAATSPPARGSQLKWLYTHNPFYAISAVLMLFAVRTAYGELVIGRINLWIMMGVLASYTALLTGICILIVRWGKVWEDARSILLLLLVLLLAISISVDDLFAKMDSSQGGTALVLLGFLFSAAVSEVVLRGLNIRLGWGFRGPYHLFLALFFAAPWWCSPELHPRPLAHLEAWILMFPILGAVLVSALLPAVMRGPGYVRQNGTPWNWPWFPWTAFGVLIGAVAMRSYALSLTFAPTGPIWRPLSSGKLAINFDTIWAPYFLAPLVLAVLVVILEAGLSVGNRRVVRSSLAAGPLLLIMGLPMVSGPVGWDFYLRVTRSSGSPVWLGMLLMAGFYVWGLLRRVEHAEVGALACLLLGSVIGPRTTGMSTLLSPLPWPFLAAALIVTVMGLKSRSSIKLSVGAALLAAGLWLELPETPLAVYRFNICFHLIWLSVMGIGFWLVDRWARVLRIVGACLVPTSVAVVMTAPQAVEVPFSWKPSYVVIVLSGCYLLARLFHDRWYLYGFVASLGLSMYGGATLGYRAATRVIGLPAIAAGLWSLGSLVLAVLISAHKADWLPRRLFPHSVNGVTPPKRRQEGAGE